MKSLVISVHPDDETLGCGGTLLNYANKGVSINWLIVTAAAVPQFSADQIAKQDEQIKAVKQAYPFDSLEWLKYPTTQLDTLPLNMLVTDIRDAVKKLRPEIIFVPNRSDAHSDHRVVSQAIQAVTKSFYMRNFGLHKILAYEVLSETDAAPPLIENAFLPNIFADVSSTINGKIDIMRLYQTEIQDDPLPRGPSAIRALARYRGSTIGVEYAEAFMLIRELM